MFSEFKKAHVNFQQDPVPLWLEEGLAEYARCTYTKSVKESCFDNVRNLNSQIPLTMLETQNDWLMINDINSAYYSSFIKVSNLIESNGKNFLVTFPSKSKPTIQ